MGAALLWGILSIVLSPCHLASIPLIVGYIDDQGRTSMRHAFTLSLLFGLGILVTIAAIGVGTAAMGRLVGDVGAWGTYVAAAVLILVGLYLMDVVSVELPRAGADRLRRRGLLAAFAIGLLFGLALGPCTFAYMAPMLTVTLGTAHQAPLYGAALLLAYGVGHCGVIVAAGTSTELVQRWLDWNSASRGATILKRVCGILVILAALYLIWTGT
ncbi:MAG: cytochrome C biogenesis protein [Armatimonadia bacterium]|nr:cytochrome C biogenesis protein [Armatimonadia bacterium]